MELKSKIIAGATIVLGVIIVFSVLASMMPVAQTSGDSLSDSSLCSAAGCFYNSTRSNSCSISNVTGSDLTRCATATSVPLSGLFSGTGIIFIIIMASMIILIIRHVMIKK
jgi:hypothetical protein